MSGKDSVPHFKELTPDALVRETAGVGFRAIIVLAERRDQDPKVRADRIASLATNLLQYGGSVSLPRDRLENYTAETLRVICSVLLEDRIQDRTKPIDWDGLPYQERVCLAAAITHLQQLGAPAPPELSLTPRLPDASAQALTQA
jgi:hypothetical protein